MKVLADEALKKYFAFTLVVYGPLNRLQIKATLGMRSGNFSLTKGKPSLLGANGMVLRRRKPRPELNGCA